MLAAKSWTVHRYLKNVPKSCLKKPGTQSISAVLKRRDYFDIILATFKPDAQNCSYEKQHHLAFYFGLPPSSK